MEGIIIMAIGKNKTRKIALLLLASIMVFTSTFLGVQATKAYADTSNSIIQLSIYARYGDGSSSSSDIGLGHAWLVIENGTSSSYSFYNTTILAGETFSIGTWGNINDPDTNKTVKGAWLNLEAYYQMSDSTASLTIEITPSQLSIVSEKSISMNKWSAINNCSYFASKVWNSVAPNDKQVNSYFFPANYPSTLKNSIQKISGYQTNRSFEYNDYTGYCTSTTNFKHIEASRISSGSSSGSSSLSLNDYYSSFPEEFDTVEKIHNAYELTEYNLNT